MTVGPVDPKIIFAQRIYLLRRGARRRPS